MKLHNLKKASDYEVKEWIFKSIPNLTQHQKTTISDDYNCMIRRAPFEFYKKKKKVNNFFIRLTIVPFVFVYLLLLLGLPFNFILTGMWGYSSKTINWFDKWRHYIGF